MSVLKRADAKRFRETGYVCIPRFFTPRETRALKHQVDRWHRDGELRNVATDGDGETPAVEKQNLQLIPLHTRSALYRALPFHEHVVTSVSALLGDPVIKILDQLFLKPPRMGTGTNWHTDNAYFRLADPLAGTAMWIALDDATRENGTLKVIPGRLNETFPHERDPYSNHHIRTEVVEKEAVHCELEAGGVVFFAFGTPHATGDNQTDVPRTGVGLHFVNFDRSTDLMRERDAEKRRWEQIFLSGARATGGEREYGKRIAGTFEQEVDRVLAGGQDST